MLTYPVHVCVHEVLVFILLLYTYQADCVWYCLHTLVHVYIMHNM